MHYKRNSTLLLANGKTIFDLDRVNTKYITPTLIYHHIIYQPPPPKKKCGHFAASLHQSELNLISLVERGGKGKLILGERIPAPSH